MPLDPATEKRIRDEAARRGVDPGDAVAEAEKFAAKKQPSATGSSDEPAKPDGRPTFDRFLLGALPFVTVREFRSVWLGLSERVPDDDLMTGDFLAKHGGAAAAPAEPDPPA